MSFKDSQLFSENILSSLEADGLYNPDAEGTQSCELMLEWGFSRKSPELKEQGITLKNLKLLTESDLADLFKNDTIGAGAEFRHQLITWRKANGCSAVSTCDTASVNSEYIDFINQWRQRNNTDSESPSCSQTSSSSSYNFVSIYSMQNKS